MDLDLVVLLDLDLVVLQDLDLVVLSSSCGAEEQQDRRSSLLLLLSPTDWSVYQSFSMNVFIVAHSILC